MTRRLLRATDLLCSQSDSQTHGYRIQIPGYRYQDRGYSYSLLQSHSDLTDMKIFIILCFLTSQCQPVEWEKISERIFNKITNGLKQSVLNGKYKGTILMLCKAFVVIFIL